MKNQRKKLRSELATDLWLPGVVADTDQLRSGEKFCWYSNKGTMIWVELDGEPLPKPLAAQFGQLYRRKVNLTKGQLSTFRRPT